MPSSKVVDAGALLAWVRDEQPAANHVRDCFEQADDGRILLCMSWINAGEAYCMLARKHDLKTAEHFLKRLPTLPIRLELPGEEDIVAAAKLKSLYRISYADAFATALALKESAPLITGDPELRDLANGLQVEWIGS